MANKIKKSNRARAPPRPKRASSPDPFLQAREEAAFYAQNPSVPESSAAAQRRQDILELGQKLRAMSHVLAETRFEGFAVGITNREFNIRVGLPPDMDAEFVRGIPGSGE